MCYEQLMKLLEFRVLINFTLANSNYNEFGEYS